RLIERVESRAVQRLGELRAGRRAPQPQLIDRPHEFLAGRRRVLHRQGGQPAELVGILAHQHGHAVIVAPAEREGRRGVDMVEIGQRAGRQHLEIDPRLRHPLETQLGVGEGAVVVAHADQAIVADAIPGAALLVDAVLRPMGPGGAVGRREADMRVNVDAGRGLDTRHGELPETVSAEYSVLPLGTTEASSTRASPNRNPGSHARPGHVASYPIRKIYGSRPEIRGFSVLEDQIISTWAGKKLVLYTMSPLTSDRMATDGGGRPCGEACSRAARRERRGKRDGQRAENDAGFGRAGRRGHRPGPVAAGRRNAQVRDSTELPRPPSALLSRSAY